MNGQDRIHARTFLEEKRLSSDQIEQVMAESDRTGRSIREIAVGRGLLSALDFQVGPSKQVSTGTIFLLFAGLMVLMGGALLATWHFQKRSHARDSLAKARAAMAVVEARSKTTPGSPDVTRALNGPLADYSAYLETLPDDAEALIERAAIYEHLRRYDLAIADLRRAAQLKPDRAAALEQKIVQLRRLSSQNLK